MAKRRPKTAAEQRATDFGAMKPDEAKSGGTRVRLPSRGKWIAARAKTYRDAGEPHLEALRHAVRDWDGEPLFPARAAE